MCSPNLKWYSEDGKKFHLVGNGYSGPIILPLCDPDNKKEITSPFLCMWVDELYFSSNLEHQCQECKENEKISRKEALEISRDTLINAERERLELAEKEAEIYNNLKGEMIWLVGESYTDQHPKAWELIGIFSTKEKAIAACKDWRYFVVCLNMDNSAPQESAEMPNYFFPKG